MKNQSKFPYVYRGSIKKSPNIFFKIVLICILLAGFYLVGFLQGHGNLVFERNFTPKIVGTELTKPKEVDFSLFWDVWSRIENKFLGEKDTQKMIYGAISGMISALNDPYTAFMTPTESKKFLDELSGEFEGIGAEIGVRNNKFIIIAPLEASPAQKVGLKPGDQILKIGGQEVAGLSLSEVIDQIRGKKGTKVTLTILRESFPSPKDFEIVRDKIKVESVKWEMKQNNVAYLKITQFGTDTSQLVQKVAEKILAKSPKGLILDLRNNPGGYLDAAVDTASLFIPEGVVVIEEGKAGFKNEFKSTLKPKFLNIKVVILINEGSASGSEIVAGAISDAKRGILIGKKTFGKGSVQDLENFKDGSALRLTVANWLTPSGRQINGQGISPDIEVNISEEEQNKGLDPQLQRALEEVLK